MTDAPLKGRHVLMMFALGFGGIIAANLTLAVSAVRTFPGLETANSYVASQEFDARRAAQEALGWEVAVDYADRRLRIAITGADGRPVDPTRLSARIGRPTMQAQDRLLAFDRTGETRATLAPGRWRLDLESQDGRFARSFTLEVPE